MLYENTIQARMNWLALSSSYERQVAQRGVKKYLPCHSAHAIVRKAMIDGRLRCFRNIGEAAMNILA
jgi:hypothetical protein